MSDHSTQLLARAVCDAVFSSLLNAERDPLNEAKWRAHADKLEQKFITEHGRHYAHFLDFSRIAP